MSKTRAWWLRLAGLFRKQEREREFVVEMESHLQMHIEENLRGGLTPQEARRQALIKLGGIEQARESHREQRGMPRLEAVWQDARYGLRALARTPGFALAAVLTLALGIGANTAIFSVVNTVLLRPLPYEHASSIVKVWHTPPQSSFPGMTRFSLSPANYLDWHRQNTVFEHFAAYHFESYNFATAERPEAVMAASVAPEFFSVLRFQPLLGRAFTPQEAEPGNDKVVVLGHRFWQSRLNGSTRALGEKIRLNGESYTVIGVMPAGFRFPDWAELWTPLAWSSKDRAVRDDHNYLSIARLKPDASVAQAQAELSAIAARLEQQYPEANKGWGALVVPLRTDVVGDVQPALLVLLGAVAFVLLIACANVANLVLARTLARRKEIALRAALGASRRRILQQILCETVLLALAGGTLGFFLAFYSVDGIIAFLGDQLPRATEIHIDRWVLAFTGCISILTGIAAGIAPALRLTRVDLNEALKQGMGKTSADSGGTRTRSVLVIAEVAISLVLLIGAGLMIRTLAMLRSVNPGFDPSSVVGMTLATPQTKYATEAQRAAFFDRVLGRVRTLPGVESAAAVSSLPLTGSGSTQPLQIDGRPVVPLSEQPQVAVREITPGYLKTMRIPLVRGRDIDSSDVAGRPNVVLVSQSMAEKFWPNEEVIGRRLTLSFVPGVVREIVGVVGDVKQESLAVLEPSPTIYQPLAQRPSPWMTLVVRTPAETGSVVRAVAGAIAEVDPEQPILEVKTAGEIVDGSVAQQRFSMLLLAVFAGFALILAGMGIYGVLAYIVRGRVREIGIRIALGAQRADVLWMVLRYGLKLALAGLVIGTVAALGLTRLLTGLLFGVQPADPLTFAAAAGLLCAIALLACYFPARRAMRIDPMAALRFE